MSSRCASACAPAACRPGRRFRLKSRCRRILQQAIRASWNADAPAVPNAVAASTAARAHAAAGAASRPAGASLDLLGFTLILDDIVSPTGESSMGRLGGGGPQSLWGFQLQRAQTAHVALAAGVGHDLPADCPAWLDMCGVDTGALLLPSAASQDGDCRTPRAWQILEEDGRRHEIWRTPFTPQLVRMLRPSLSELPPAYRLARAFHVGVHPHDPSLELLRELRAAAAEVGGLVSAETFAAAGAAVPAADLAAFMRELDVFSPNEAEAASMLFGPAAPGTGTPAAAAADVVDPRRLTEPFLEAGARLVALRRGAQGAVVHDGAGGECWRLPAYPGTRVVDPTGCGNAFCGALLGALLAGDGFVAAAAWGCAAGSLMAECSGTPKQAPRELAEEASRRQAVVLALAQQW